jgi:hypothetical protein
LQSLGLPDAAAAGRRRAEKRSERRRGRSRVLKVKEESRKAGKQESRKGGKEERRNGEIQSPWIKRFSKLPTNG